MLQHLPNPFGHWNFSPHKASFRVSFHRTSFKEQRLNQTQYSLAGETGPEQTRIGQNPTAHWWSCPSAFSLCAFRSQITSKGKLPRCPSTWQQQGEPGWWVQDASLCLEHPAQTSSCPLPGREACASDGKPASPHYSLKVEWWMLSKVLATCEGGSSQDTVRPFRDTFHIGPTGESHSPISLQQCSGSRKWYPRVLKLGWYLTMSSNTSGSDPPIIDRGQRSGNLLSLDTVKQANREEGKDTEIQIVHYIDTNLSRKATWDNTYTCTPDAFKM